MIFIFIIFIQVCVFGGEKFSDGDPQDFKEIMLPFKDASFYSWMKTLSVFLVGFSFTINLFPIYSGLKIKTNANC